MIRVLMVHNGYQLAGGEDRVVEAEMELLKRRGHEVELYRRSNFEVSDIRPVSLAAQTIWSRRTVVDLGRLVDRFQPEVVHVHNTLPLISPSVFWAASRHQVPVVQTLHNFRLLCLQGTFLRNGQPCTDCLGTSIANGIARRCYRDSLAASVVLGASVSFHRRIGTYAAKVSRFVALTEFSQRLLIEGGVPPGKIVVKGNFADVSFRRSEPGRGGLFVGRFSEEKGIAVLADALRQLAGLSTFEAIGAGPEWQAFQGIPGLTVSEWMAEADVLRRMSQAAYLVIPSICYDNFPRTLVEAFGSGLPVIASRIGSFVDLIDDGVTGLLFDPGSASSLASAIRFAEANPDRMALMGRACRERYERYYTPAANYDALLSIYDSVRARGVV